MQKESHKPEYKRADSTQQEYKLSCVSRCFLNPFMVLWRLESVRTLAGSLAALQGTIVKWPLDLWSVKPLRAASRELLRLDTRNRNPSDHVLGACIARPNL